MSVSTRKREPRKSVLQSGWITLDGGFAARPCTVENLSENGAKLILTDKDPLPAQFRLSMTRDLRRARPCAVKWRKGMAIGVRFVA